MEIPCWVPDGEMLATRCMKIYNIWELVVGLVRLVVFFCVSVLTADEILSYSFVF